MTLKTDDFSYVLPTDRISQAPAEPRESAKLMVVNRKTGTITHRHVADFPAYLKKGDVLVVNNTKVFHARLKKGNKELFLVRPHGDHWIAIGRNIKEKETLIFNETKICITKKHSDGTLLVKIDTNDVISFANTYGEIPIPPYIHTMPKDSDYQTVYAKFVGSVAAPTAGFHLTKPLLQKIKDKGVTILEITLHVGLGTFMPIKSDTLDAHPMHSEWVEITPEVAQQIKRAKRVVAVGTTTVRALEGTGCKSFQGDVNIFIQPGYKFKIVDAMLTNFHLPKSTLIVLVSAFASRELILKAYNEAVRKFYRFYSFGDAMFII